ncbi:hypothetical protein [Sandarakinorhabdus sp.]|uniref:hypothetical protein n=1 Tax=Sandarakinorhabdus sp. TaxID=1916663 RepID=UPI003342C210
MILTHFIAFLAQAATVVGFAPTAAQMALADAGTAVTLPRRPLAEVPALTVGAAPLLAVRGP